VLSGLIREVVVPNTRRLLPVSVTLRDASATLAKSPTLPALRATRTAWRRAALAWKAASVFQDGPLVESKALQRASYWPVLPAAIETLVAAESPLDARGIEDVSLNQRGLYALEYLLFPADSEEARTLAALAHSGAARRRELVRALAADLVSHAERALGMLGDGKAYARRFEQGGQQSLSLLLAEIILGVETFAVNRIDLVLNLSERKLLRPSDVEGCPSGSSQELVQTVLAAAERLYRGEESGGLADLVRAVAPAADERAQTAFHGALSAAKRLEVSLERAAVESRDRLRAALTAGKALETALKVEVASALGVTLTFQTGDGD
jgi:predicted lipoprotein